MTLDPYLTYQKQKQAKDLKMASRTKGKSSNNKTCRRKLVGENLHGIGYGKGFLDLIPKAQTTKENIKWSGSKLNILGHHRTPSTRYKGNS